MWRHEDERKGLMVDAGATSHIITDIAKFRWFDSSFQADTHCVELADGTRCNGVAKNRGDAAVCLVDSTGRRFKTTLRNGLYIPTYPQDIFSVKAATSNGATVIFREGKNVLLHKDCTEFPIHAQLEKTQAKVKMMIQDRIKKTEEIKSSEKNNNVKSLTALIERFLSELLEVIGEKQKSAEKQAEELLKELEQEVTELKSRETALEQLSHGGSSAPPTAVNVRLDPKTAHPKLILSKYRKQVKHSGSWRDVPNNPERFDSSACVLGKDGFSCGKIYYEVEVGDKTEWDLGMARESIDRKGKVTVCPENLFWSIWLRNGGEYVANESCPVPLSLKDKPQKVGVFVDYEEGLVSFYNVETKALIYSFTGQSFTEKIYPFFSPCNKRGDVTTKPLIIY
ncbi:zinc-binding protein A33-like [Carassius carassius]|uniref:zinc-binding protein A33-like n=1 Tax=Carassius carassius TaxID=217509 RepID=UPI002868D87E|nr:zinc-binding protein A33-like [Carassius carassius]